MKNGQARRELMMRFIRRRGPDGLCVNKRWTFSTQEETISELLKRGLLKQTRVLGLGVRHTMLVPTDGVWFDPNNGPLTCPECDSRLTSLWESAQHKDGCTLRLHRFGIYKGARRLLNWS